MTSTIDGLVELLTEYKHVRILELRQKQYAEWLGNHPLANRLIADIELVKDSRGVDIITKLNGKTVYLGKDLKAALNQKNRCVFVDVITDQTENVYPMIVSGKGHHEMHLAPSANEDIELA